MRSIIGGILDAARTARPSALATPSGPPVPFSGRRTGLLGLLGGGASEGQLQAMTAVGTLFAIVDCNAESTAAVKWKLWQKAASGKDEDRIEITSHAALDLWNKPNDFWTGEQLREAGQQHFELVGETWLVVARVANIPVEMWEVRPDRISPVPHPKKYLVGYVYKGPDGEKIPLELQDVKRIFRPHPMDPYRGVGAVQSMLNDIDSARYSAEWNRNFFINSAEPGGIIEYENELSDTEWQQWVARWREQHQGVAQAHRVGMLEKGMKWVDRKYSMRDMQFTELRALSREVIREAFRFPKPLLGTVDDVNRANAEAMDAIYARWTVEPRAKRWKGLANHGILPMYPTAVNYEFDYENVVPADRAADDAELTARSTAAKTLVEAGYDRAEVLTAVGLPDIAIASQPEPAAAEPPPEDPSTTVDDAVHNAVQRAFAAMMARHPDLFSPERPRNEGSELDRVQAEWEAALAALLASWQGITEAQREQAIQQVRRAVEQGDTTALSQLSISSTEATALLAGAMAALASLASETMTAEAAAQGVPDADEAAVTVTDEQMEAVAGTVTALLATSLAVSAGQEALRLLTAVATADEVADGVRTHLESLSDTYLRDRLGGALTRAQNEGRIAAARNLPVARYYATEELDRNTCTPCKNIDKEELPSLDAAITAYGGGSYIYCAGRDRCRGTFRAEWETE